jgi:hypothetical protein
MRGVVNVIRILHKQYGTVPADHETDRGFYTIENSVPKWISMEIERGIPKYDLERLVENVRLNIDVPVFCENNVGELRMWPQLLYSELSNCDVALIQVAASIYTDSGKMGMGVPSDHEIIECAKRIRSQCVTRVPNKFSKLIDEIADTVIYDESKVPWCLADVYRRSTVRSTLTGVVVDLSGPKSADGDQTVDFQDVFAALAPLAMFLYCPTPKMIMNNSSELILDSEDINTMTGVVDGHTIIVQRELEISADEKRDLEPGQSTMTVVNKVIEALQTHAILTRPITPGSVIPKYTTTFYFETSLPFNPQFIYATGVLFPRTHGRNFYINELTNISVNRKKNGVYYQTSTPEGGKMETKLFIETREAKERTGHFIFKYGNGAAKLTTYKVSIDHKHHTHASRFEFDLVQLLAAMKSRFDTIKLIARMLSPALKEPCWISPPGMSKFTKMFISKNEGKERCPDAPRRPIYIPPNFAGDPNLAINIAMTLSWNFHQSPDYVYVSSGNKIVLYRECGGEIDSFSALYVSPRHGIPTIENKSKDKDAVMPWIPSNNKTQSMRQPVYSGLTPAGIWRSDPLYDIGTSNHTLYDTLKRAFPRTLTAPTLIDLLGDKCEHYAGLCKPEFFDRNTNEIIATFNEPDSTLHLRIFEHILRKNILVAVPTQTLIDKKTGKHTLASIYRIIDEDNPRVELELPRHAGQPIRDFVSFEDSLVLFKYYDGKWCYSMMSYSDQLVVVSGLNSWTSDSISANSAKIIKREIRDQILSKHYFPVIDAFNFFERKRVVQEIELQHMALAAKVVSQSVNADGYSTSIKLQDILYNVVISIIKLCSDFTFKLGNAADFVMTEIVEITICFRTPVIPLAVPVIDDGVIPISTTLMAALGLVRKNLDPDTTSSSDAMPSSDTMPIGNHVFVSVTATPAASKDQVNVITYQRQMTVFLSLMSWCMLQYGSVLTPIVIDQMCEIIAIHAKRAIVKKAADIHFVCDVLVKHRFPPKFVTGNGTEAISGPAQALDSCIRTYFGSDSFIPMNSATIASIRNFAATEAFWIVKNIRWLTRGAIWYISGIHDFVPTERVVPSPETRMLYTPASRGLTSIVSTRKQYEYAVARRYARTTLTSWNPFREVTDITTAAGLENYTSFVRRMPNGAVVYGFILEISERDDGTIVRRMPKGIELLRIHARNIGLGDNVNIPVIIGFENFRDQTFNVDTLAIFNTSGNENQGSMYRIHVFAPR